MALLKPLIEFRSHKNSFTLIEEEHHKSKVRNLYKYMDLETALICIKNKSIRFVQPSEWPDKYERHFYDADNTEITVDPMVTPRLWACCFTTSKISEASWNTYRYGKRGLGNKCVKFQLSRSKFRDFLRKDKRVKCTYEGFMDYSVSDFDIQHLHLKSSHLYGEVFNRPFALENFLSLLLLKRSAFNYENEFRFLLSLKKELTDMAIYIPVNWDTLIEKIEVDKDMSDMELDVLKTYLKLANVRQGIIDTISRSNLYNDPVEIVKIEG